LPRRVVEAVEAFRRPGSGTVRSARAAASSAGVIAGTEIAVDED
jgi:hypothetical protein